MSTEKHIAPNEPVEQQQTWKRKALELHEKYGGKIGTQVKIPVRVLADLALAYSPGVAEPCRKIAASPAEAFRYTNKANTIAVVTDGSAVLGLGRIGAAAALPVMEGKALLFKHFAGLDAAPICLNTKTPEQFIEACCALEPNFGGINLEDISAPNCVIIERELQRRLSIPVFHDDQHGTAIVVAAALQNAAKLTNRKLENMRVVICGMGAAGSAIARMLKHIGASQIFGADASGPLRKMPNPHNFVIQELFDEGIVESASSQCSSLRDLLCGADAFVGVSAGGLLKKDMISLMAKNPIILAMANPEPEIRPEEAFAAGAAIVGTGRMDYPNQINNILAFPGVFLGALRAQRERAPQNLATQITLQAKLVAAQALAAVLGPDELSPHSILPSPMDPRVVEQVSRAVYEQLA